MPVIRVGVQSPQGSPGQVVDLDGPRASIASITNVSAESIAYSLDGGSSWATLAAGASGGAATIDAGMLRMRKVSSGAYPANVDVDAAIFGLSDPSLSAAQVTATAALVSEAGNITSAAIRSTTGTPGQVVKLADGDDKGMLLQWLIPAGSTSYTWCWFLSPNDAY